MSIENGNGHVEEKNTDELQYLDQIRKIMVDGTARSDRTGTGTISIFGMQSRYSLRDGELSTYLLVGLHFRYHAFVDHKTCLLEGHRGGAAVVHSRGN